MAIDYRKIVFFRPKSTFLNEDCQKEVIRGDDFRGISLERLESHHGGDPLPLSCLLLPSPLDPALSRNLLILESLLYQLLAFLG